jgi:hypothetical protein
MDIVALTILLVYPKDAVDKPLYDYEKRIFDSLVTQNGNGYSSISIYG